MFSERLERLIEASLQDGQLTEQEKAAIIKRAEAEGEDINEVDIYIQSLQQKRQQELNLQAQLAATEEMVAQKKARETKQAAAAEEEKERAKLLRKCPACGTPIPAVTNVCPNCGHVVESDDFSKEITDLIKLINKCAPHDVDSDGKADLTEYRSKSVYDKDPNSHKLYDIIDEGSNDNYEIKSKYYELINDLEIKYGEVPMVKSFLTKERTRIAGLIKAKCLYFLEGGNYLNYVQSCLTILRGSYSDVVDATFFNDCEKKIEAVRIRNAKREAKRKTISGRISSWFSDYDNKAWAIVIAILIILAVLSFTISLWILIPTVIWLIVMPFFKKKIYEWL